MSGVSGAAAAEASTRRTRPATMAKARLVRSLIQRDYTPAAIAEMQGISERRVWQLLNEPVTEAPAAVASDPDSVDQAAVAIPVRAPRKQMTRRMLLDRAWTAAHEDFRVSSLSHGERWLWLTIVLTINRLGDEEGLFFGEPTDDFESRADFLAMLGGSEEFLTLLLRRRVLVELEGGGIGLPDKLGLKQRERKSSAPPLGAFPVDRLRPAQARQGGKAPVPGQRSFLMSVPGGAAGSGRTADAEGENFSPTEILGGENFSENFSGGEILGRKFQEIISPGAAEGTTTTTTQVIDSLESSSSSSGNRASAENFSGTENFSENFSGGPGENFSENFSPPPAPSDGDASAPAWVSIAADLAQLVGLRRTVTMPELVAVRGWLEAGLSLEELRGIFHTVLQRENRPALPALTYFQGAIDDALEAEAQPPSSEGRADRTSSEGRAGRTMSEGRATRANRGKAKATADTAPGASDAEIEAAITLAETWAAPEIAAPWARIRARLKTDVGEVEYRTWLRQMALAGIDGDEMTVVLPSVFLRDWVASRHGDRIATLWRAENPEIRRIDFRVRAVATPGKEESAESG